MPMLAQSEAGRYSVRAFQAIEALFAMLLEKLDSFLSTQP